jgi:hypothetical protein
VGTLAHLLKNRFYVGEVTYRGEVHRGEHEPILSRDLFEAVQAKRAANGVARQVRLRGSAAILAGRLFDDRDNRMSPTHATVIFDWICPGDASFVTSPGWSETDGAGFGGAGVNSRATAIQVAASTQMAITTRAPLPLAFLSPHIIAAIVDGTAPADLTVIGLAKALPNSREAKLIGDENKRPFADRSQAGGSVDRLACGAAQRFRPGVSFPMVCSRGS